MNCRRSRTCAPELSQPDKRTHHRGSGFIHSLAPSRSYYGTPSRQLRGNNLLRFWLAVGAWPDIVARLYRQYALQAVTRRLSKRSAS